jgi:hypothetical protein
MKPMNLPGFTAEASLYRLVSTYGSKTVHGSGRALGAVVPQLRVPTAPGCGECTSLRWPDGTPTGACARACCDVLGRCSTETCPCGSGGIFNGGWGRVIRW